ncbi:hypothetical protein [Sphingomonas sp.]|uniref:hypothetical protein n=1 Tax=Sphingomonas sp. TaxID=28214 RepID=UPI003B3BCD3E
MSEHHVEDLVESSVRLLLGADLAVDAKRGLAHDLYRLQAQFDTSDTSGRLGPELEAIGYDPDAQSSARPLLAIAADMIALADQAGDRQLVRDWLALLINGIDDTTLIDDTLPEDFHAFQALPEAVAIRTIAGRRQELGWRGLDAAIPLPSWTGIARDYDRFAPADMDRRSMLRFLLDHRADAAKIAAEFDKDKQRIARSADTLASLPAMVAARGPFRCIADATSGSKRSFAFEAGDPPADADAARFHLIIDHDADLNVLYPWFGVRSGLIERWQGSTPAFDDAGMHFRESMIGFVPGDLLKADTQLSGTGWRWRRDQSAALLEKRLDAILGYWPHAAALERFYAKPLAARIDEEGFELMASKRVERFNAYGFFVNDVDILFACACRAWDRGTRPTAEIAAIRDWLAHVPPDKRADRVSCLKRLETGPAFPRELSRWPIRRLDERFPIEP